MLFCADSSGFSYRYTRFVCLYRFCYWGASILNAYTAILSVIFVLVCFQESGRDVIEYLFPQSPPTFDDKLFFGDNRSTWTAVKSGSAFHNPMWLPLQSGSRVEGLHLGKGQAPVASDRDIMYLYGGAWGVRVESGCRGIESETSALVMDQSQCPPGYCRVRMTTVEGLVIQHMAQYFLRGICLIMHIPLFMILSFILSFSFSFLFYITGLLGEEMSVALCVVVLHCTVYSIPVIICRNSRPVYLMLHHLSNLPVLCTVYKLLQIGSKNVKKCIAYRGGEYFLSSAITLNVLRDINHDKTYQGPAQTSQDTDHVPALICSAPFPWITRYIYQPRSSQWPSKNALEDIRILPGLLVPTGKKGNVDCDLQWRQSCSLQELRLAQDMPDWVKGAFRSLKATMKFVKKRIENKDFCGTVLGSRFIARVLRYFLTSKQTAEPCKNDVSVVCSFHMKNVLLWQLEEVDSWQHMCSFRLMIQLLIRLDHHLETGHLPHYFNPECNLLDNVQEAELMMTRHCIKIILSDPVDAMIKSSKKSSTKGLPVRLGKAIDYWLSPKIYLASIHSAFKAALVPRGFAKQRACNVEQWCVRCCLPESNNQSDYCWSVTPLRQWNDFYDT